ncbi:hypothetical protein [Streptomyces sp. NPDC087270]|uniref:hypothetical protein n=1 Tax=Streptomyces sp. NPDC087270 TaxID=3365774 RepID=UPI003820409F
MSTGLVCGQSYQHVLRGRWVPPQPGQLGVIEACHALNLVGLPRAGLREKPQPVAVDGEKLRSGWTVGSAGTPVRLAVWFDN